MPGPAVIQSLWVGEALSTMERLSVASFLAAGHGYYLYVYRPVANVPEGAELRDACEVLPESMVFQYPKCPSYAGFSNFFRYKLLSDRGGWWVDTDAVCLRPFDFPDDYVIGTELTIEGEAIPTSGFLKAPAGSGALRFAWEECLGKDPTRLAWGETGPRLVAEAMRRFSLDRFLREPSVFTPVPHFAWEHVLEPGWDGEFPDTTHAVHLWNEKWRRAGRDKDASYPPDCLYERLKARFL
jgi:hypothetical protein